MKKVLFVATVTEHINAFHTPYLKWFKEQGWETHVASKGDAEIPYCDKKHEVSFQRSPFKPDNIKAYRQLKSIIDTEQFSLVHCHTPMGGVLGRLCSRRQRKRGMKVIYTAHGFHFHKGAPLINWLIYYPVEKLCSYLTDAIITINQEDYALAIKKMRAKHIYYVPGVGVDTERFSNTVVDREKKRAEIGVPNNAVMLLSVGELNHNKNHEVIIRAIAKLNNPNIHFCVAGQGELKEYLERMATELEVNVNVHLLGYRNDVNELYSISDVFCFPSLREGLGLAAIEAMSSGLPIITSNVHGIKDYSKNNLTGYSCPPKSINDFVQAIDILARDTGLRLKMGENNKNEVKRFDIQNALVQHEKIYKETMEQLLKEQ